MKVTDQNGKEIATQNARAVTGTNKLQFEVVNPLKWTAETPNLYNLTILLKQKGKTVDIRSVKVGFRKIELAQDWSAVELMENQLCLRELTDTTIVRRMVVRYLKKKWKKMCS